MVCTNHSSSLELEAGESVVHNPLSYMLSSRPIWNTRGCLYLKKKKSEWWCYQHPKMIKHRSSTTKEKAGDSYVKSSFWQNVSICQTLRVKETNMVPASLELRVEGVLKPPQLSSETHWRRYQGRNCTLGSLWESAYPPPPLVSTALQMILPGELTDPAACFCLFEDQAASPSFLAPIPSVHWWLRVLISLSWFPSSQECQ